MSAPTPNCNICGHIMTPAFTGHILAEHHVQYFSCPQCYFFCTERPYWLSESYSNAIAATDTGIVMRNIKIAHQLSCLLPNIFDYDAKFIDVAGGTGLLTRLMRDNGFDFYWEDRYCENTLAFGFEASADGRQYDAVTAFEAIEHMEDPSGFVKDCISRSKTGTFIFTTELFASHLPVEDWWYLSKVTGQHISFFSLPTLLQLAENLGTRFLSHRNLHLFTRMELSQKRYQKLLDREERHWRKQTAGKKSGLTTADHITMTRRVLSMRDKNPTKQAVESIEQPAYSLSRSGLLGRITQQWRRNFRDRTSRSK